MRNIFITFEFFGLVMEEKINGCQTLAELGELERTHLLNEEEQRLMFERRLQIFQRIHEWREENKKLGIEPAISDFWTPEQRQRFLNEWNDDSYIIEASRGEKRTYDEMMSEEPSTSHQGALQMGRGEGDEGDNERPFYIESARQVYTKKFKTNATSYRIRFTNVIADAEITSLHERLHEIFQQILDETVGGVPPQDQIRFVLHSNQLDKPIRFPFMPAERLTTEHILAKFEQVIQSNQEFRLNDTVEINVIHVSMPIGGKRSKRSEVNLGKHLEKKRSVVRIRNDDDLCMVRALVVAKAKLDNDPQYKSIVDYRGTMQTRLARELHHNAGVPLEPCGIEQAKLFQAYLPEYQINIVSKEYNNNIIYAGPEKDKRIYLYMHDNHYDVITKMPGFFARHYYCHTCKKAYDHHEEHLCPNECKCCGFSPICPKESWRSCKDCHRQFKSQRCYDQHKRPEGNARPVCQSLIRCMKCMEVVERRHLAPEKHLCGKRKCGTCGKYVQLEGHRCYIQPETKKKRKNPTPEEEEEMPENGYDVAGFFDMECRQGEREDEDEAVEESMKELLFFDLECRQENGNHEPNLCVVQDEAGEEWIFQGDKTIDEFCEWLFTTEHAGCTVMAHNFQGYDSYFILQYLRKQGVKYDVIMRGAKVLSLKVELFDIRFIDSLNFLPMKLASLPKTFGIEELAKGHFPHFFKEKENENYVGPIPPATYYNPDGMNPKDREAFTTRHATKKESNYVFNFK